MTIPTVVVLPSVPVMPITVNFRAGNPYWRGRFQGTKTMHAQAQRVSMGEKFLQLSDHKEVIVHHPFQRTKLCPSATFCPATKGGAKPRTNCGATLLHPAMYLPACRQASSSPPPGIRRRLVDDAGGAFPSPPVARIPPRSFPTQGQ